MSPLQWTFVVIWFGLGIAAVGYLLSYAIERIDTWWQRKHGAPDWHSHQIITSREVLSYCPECFGWFPDEHEHA